MLSEAASLKLEEKATKLVANSLYGDFGSKYFDFRDVRVAELVTGNGRSTILELKSILEKEFGIGQIISN